MHSDLKCALVKVPSGGLPEAPWAGMKRSHSSQDFQPVSFPLILTTEMSRG